MNRGTNDHVHRGAPTTTRLDVRQTIRCMVGRTDTLTHSALYINHRRALYKYMRHALINRWDEVIQSTNKLIMDCVESGCDVPGQLRTDNVSLMRVIHIQVAEGVFGLKN